MSSSDFNFLKHFWNGAHFFIHGFKFLERNRFNTLFFCLKISSLVVISQIARLAHAQRIIQPSLMSTGPCELSSSRFSVAWGTHVLSIMFSLSMWTGWDHHHVLSFCVFNHLFFLFWFLFLGVFVLCFVLRDFFRRDSSRFGGLTLNRAIGRGGGLFFRSFDFGGFFQNFIF